MTLIVKIRPTASSTQATVPRFAVIGHPVKHSRSPFIHQQFAAQTHLALTYERLEAPLDGFKQTVEHFFANGGRGLNVTVPFKLEAWELARAHLTTRARQAQAVNTLSDTEWQPAWLQHRWRRLSRRLETSRRTNCEGARILMIGAGGAAPGGIGTAA